ncbi:MAG: hypothetical protein PHS53_03455 [Candidatus Pacebacteria bacterium]|nr:hypothetical protein [Candidatus Paceibacterota bacterium]
MFLSSLFKKPEHEISVLFDISSRSVGGALLELSRHGKPKILYTARLEIPFHESPGSEELVSETLSALTKVTSSLQVEGIAHLSATEFKDHKVKEVFLVFSSPWYISETKIARIEKEKPFTFTERLLKEMLAHEKTSYEKAVEANQNKNVSGINFLEQKVIQIKLNGYETAKPFGQIIFSAEANILSSFIDSHLLNRVKDVVLHSFHPRHVGIHSFPGVAHSVLRDIYPGENDFFIVDVGGESTEISLIKGGGLLETFSFPVGHNQTLRKISEALEVSRDVAISSLSLFLDGKTFEKTGGKIEGVVKDMQTKWNEAFQSALGNLGENRAVPSLFYLISEPPFANLFNSVIKKIEKADEKTGAKKVVPLESKTLALHYERNGIGDGDMFLCLETIFLNKLFSKDGAEK